MRRRYKLKLGWFFVGEADADERRKTIERYESDVTMAGELPSDPGLRADYELAEAVSESTGRDSTLIEYHAAERLYRDWVGDRFDPLRPAMRDWKAFGAYLERKWNHRTKAPGLRFVTIKKILACLAHYFLKHGIVPPTRTDHHRKMLRGMRMRIRVTRRPSSKALYGPRLRQVVLHQDATTPQGAMVGYFFATMFGRAMRESEVVQITVEGTRENDVDGSLTYEIARTKTSQDADPEHRVVRHRCSSTVDWRLCPVCQYHNLRRVTGISSGPLLRRIDRWGNMSPRALRPASISWLIKRACRDAGLPDWDAYSGHALRRGHITALAKAGVALEDIARSTGHRSLEAVEAYLEIAEPRTLPIDPFDVAGPS
jgi:hypothetical protein